MPTECAEPSLSLSLDPAKVTNFDTQLSDLLPKLPDLADNQLLQLAAHAQRLASCAFRLRGACVAELRRRHCTRLPGGRGKRDTEAAGVTAQLAHMASQIGISSSTLKTDARIHEVFFAGETGLARAPSLSREYYVVALGAPDPLAAISIAEARTTNNFYTREQFRRDVRALKLAPQPLDDVASVDSAPKLTFALRVKIMPDARAALTALMARTGQSPAEAVAEAILAQHKLLTVQPIDPPTTAPKSSGNKRQTIDSQSSNAQPSLPLFY